MSQLDSIITWIRTSQMLRLCVLGVLTLVMLIPITMIGSLVSERRERSEAAIAEVSSKWGQSQSIHGPALVLPYGVDVVETPAPGGQAVRSLSRPFRRQDFDRDVAELRVVRDTPRPFPEPIRRRTS